MHELRMSEGILEATLRRACGRRVSSVRVRVAGSSTDLRALEKAFRTVASGSLAEHATIEFSSDQEPLRCEDCRALVPSAIDGLTPGPVVAALVVCPECRSLVTQWAFKDGAVLESVSLVPLPTTLCLVPPRQLRSAVHN